jgi:DNA-binding response OmpR family regulator
MPSGLVLVIEDDEWVSRLLSGAIREVGYDVMVCGTAKAGIETANAVEPDCIICDIDLPDSDGYWVARTIRTEPSRVSVTPFLFLSALDDQESRLEGFHVGADVYMTKPFRVDEVVAQVGALVQMASRLRRRRDSFLSAPTGETAAIEGDLDQMSIATVLTVLEMERRTGLFEVVSKKRRAQLEIAAGFIVAGTVGGTPVSALAALRTMLGWRLGRFSFAPLPPRDPPMSQKSIGAFLIEAVRLEDESARGELDLPPSRRRPGAEGKLAAPAIGGPASTLDDIAPPSSRAARSEPAPISVEPEPLSPRTFLESDAKTSTPASAAPKLPLPVPPGGKMTANPAPRPAGVPLGTPFAPPRPAPTAPPRPPRPEDKKRG